MTGLMTGTTPVRVGCPADSVRSLRASEIKALLDSDPSAFTLVDVRQPEEYQQGHIPGALLIPLGEMEARQGELDRGKKIILYCRAGHRSAAAAVVLCGLGFKGLYSLAGGITSWRHGTVKGMGAPLQHLAREASTHRDALMLAIKLEKGSHDFYTGAAGKMSAASARRLFETLATVEQRHMRKVFERAVKLVGRGSLPPWDDLRTSLKADYMEGGIEVDPALASMPRRFKDEMDALEIALEKEYLSYDFYQRVTALVADYDTRVFLNELAVQERGHADIILNRIAELVRK